MLHEQEKKGPYKAPTVEEQEKAHYQRKVAEGKIDKADAKATGRGHGSKKTADEDHTKPGDPVEASPESNTRPATPPADAAPSTPKPAA